MASTGPAGGRHASGGRGCRARRWRSCWPAAAAAGRSTRPTRAAPRRSSKRSRSSTHVDDSADGFRRAPVVDGRSATSTGRRRSMRNGRSPRPSCSPDVTTATDGCDDTITFTFLPSTAPAPSYVVDYADGPFTDTAGRTVKPAGSVFLRVRFQPAWIADLSQPSAPLTYTGPRAITAERARGRARARALRREEARGRLGRRRSTATHPFAVDASPGRGRDHGGSRLVRRRGSARLSSGGGSPCRTSRRSRAGRRPRRASSSGRTRSTTGATRPSSSSGTTSSTNAATAAAFSAIVRARSTVPCNREPLGHQREQRHVDVPAGERARRSTMRPCVAAAAMSACDVRAPDEVDRHVGRTARLGDRGGEGGGIEWRRREDAVVESERPRRGRASTRCGPCR